MITSAGKELIMRYLAGYINQIGDSISFGVGSNAASLTDSDLDFEIYNVKISQIGVDLAGRKLIFKVSIPADVVGVIKEVCLWSGKKVNSGLNSSDAITFVDQANEIWTGGNWDIGSKVGATTYRINAATSSNATALLTGYKKDLSSLTQQDKIAVAFESVSNVSSLRIDLGLDTANRYSAAITNPGTGYKIIEVPVANFVKTGNPSWENITYLAAVLTSTSSGAGVLKLDGIRINRSITDGTLVSRQVLAADVVKERNAPLDTEYVMAVSI